ncbi:MAG: carboxypeptidase regulatory-like domain-containing protein [Akkermansiaceae bacterium]
MPAIAANGGAVLDVQPTPGNCLIHGEVSDATSLNPIAGAIIEVTGTDRTVETDALGRFSIAGLSTGTFSLEATKLGFFSETTVITTIPAQPSEARIALRAKPADESADEVTLEEETVIGEYQGDSQGDFNLSISVDSPVLASSMGREEFAKTGVSDAGEAIAKISGANIVDGKYAVVRGLADRYVTTTFNGAQIASADPSRKAVQLDLFPTSAIEALKVEKTYSPYLSGDFGGGAIDIITRVFPEERILSASTKITYNDALGDRIRTHPNRSLGTWGNIGKQMPGSLETRDDDGTVKFIVSNDLPPDQLKERWKTLHDSQDLLPKEKESDFGYSQSLTYGETFTLPNAMRLGLMGAFSRSSGDTSNDDYVTNQTREYARSDYSRGVDWAAYLSAGLEINENHSLQGTYFNKHIAQDDVSNSTYIIDDEENLNYGRHLQNSGINPANAYGPDAIYYGAAWDVTPLERDLEIFQIKGKHQLRERGARLDWAITNSAATEQRPHSTHFEYGILDFSTAALASELARVQGELDRQAIEYARLLRLPEPEAYNWQSIKDPMYARANTQRIYDNFEAARVITPDDKRAPVNTSAHGTNSGSVPGKQQITRRSEKTSETALNQQVSGAIPYYFSEKEDRYIEFGFGMSSLNKERITTARQYDLVLSLNSQTNPGFLPGSLDGQGGLGEQIANNPSIISDYFDGTANNGPYYTNSLTRNGLENIRTELDQFSHYYSCLLRVGDSFLTGGVRHEKESYEIDIEGTPLSAFSDEQIRGNGWENRDPQTATLPSISAGTALFDARLGFQAAWSQTVARPTFWEFIPSQSIDQASGLGRRGNNELGQTDIDNFDFAVTWKPTEQATLRASFFHKNLVRPLVSFYENGVLLYDDSFLDPTTGDTRDFTGTISGIELEAEISKMGPFSLRGNFTYIDAQLDYFYVQNGEATSVTSKLPYQPTYLANLNLGYTYEPWLLNTNLVYNYNGDYPTILKLTPEDFEVTRDAIHTFDLVISKGIETEHANYLVKAGIKNLLNASDTFMYNGNAFSTENLGRSFWLELQVSF